MDVCHGSSLPNLAFCECRKYKLISHPLNTNPFPGAFLNFRAAVRLHEVTRSAATFMEWTGEFDTEPQVPLPSSAAPIAEHCLHCS